ncbi:hypothetical protein [Marivita hallyeonensis]|uniref:DUF3329 domain-containing protein n=1 Tax=Marivita hallyeonensis TaxID=996342 RepID=A0A1M5RWU1_9RHOB|nr:hypothetical protein [Marivita hallyeonensis]SHH30651.1 hypothetical protein SAMN05443551_1917 [Marivita hallyeonensis]
MPDTGKPRKRHPALNLRVSFFLPMWRRIATVAVITLWCVIEILYGNPWWALLAAGIGVYAGYVLFFDFDIEGEGASDE